MKLSWQDTTFCVDNTRKDNTGSYSCVFSVQKYNTDRICVRQNGMNSIFVSVNGKIFFLITLFLGLFVCYLIILKPDNIVD